MCANCDLCSRCRRHKRTRSDDQKTDKSLIDKWREFDGIRNSFVNSLGNSIHQTQTPTPTPIPTPIPIQTLTPEERTALRAEAANRVGFQTAKPTSIGARIETIAARAIADAPNQEPWYYEEALRGWCKSEGIRVSDDMLQQALAGAQLRVVA
jgi:hypothetical protein